MAKPFPSKERVFLADFQMAGTISVIPILLVAIGVHEMPIKAANISM